MTMNNIIAENLYRLRNERNLSLGQLAKLSDVSKVLLSQIEKGDSNPTVNTIWKIASGLKVPYTALMDTPPNDTLVISKSTINAQVTADGHYRLFCFYPTTPIRNFELFQIELDEGYRYTSIGHSEKSQEYILILKGQLALEVNNTSYVLNENDSICFAASSKHTYFNSGKAILKAAIINYYPV